MYYAQFATYIVYAMKFAEEQKTQAIATLRSWLGPAPQNYYLLDDGRIVPYTVSLPPEVYALAFMYHANTHRITRAITPNPEGRFKLAVPYLSVVVKQATQDPMDLSEWVGELRANPVPLLSFPIDQIVALWAAVKNVYMPIRYTVDVIHSDGTNGSYAIG
jgi:hypothetical protein